MIMYHHSDALSLDHDCVSNTRIFFCFFGGEGGAEAQVAEAGLELTLLSKLTLDSPASTFQVL